MVRFRSFPSLTGRIMVGVWWALISLPVAQVVRIVTLQQFGVALGWVLVLAAFVAGALVARLPWATKAQRG
jgi:hypothetical protein